MAVSVRAAGKERGRPGPLVPAALDVADSRVRSPACPDATRCRHPAGRGDSCHAGRRMSRRYSPRSPRGMIGSSASTKYSISRSSSSSSSVGGGGGGGSSGGIRTCRVLLEARAGRDQPAHRHVLLEAPQEVDLARDGRLGQHARRLLERRRRDEGIRVERRLGDAEQIGSPWAGPLPLDEHPLVLLDGSGIVHDVLDQELGVADFLLDLHPAHHLPRDDLDVLVVDVHALEPVDLLDLVDQVRPAVPSRRGR